MSILIKLRENKDFTENEEYIAKYIIKNFRKRTKPVDKILKVGIIERV